MNLNLSPRYVMFGLLGVVVGLLLLHAFIYVGNFHVESLHVGAIEQRFDLDGEGTAPALFSALILGLSSVMLLLIGSADRLRRVAWFFLALVFAFLATDEALYIHEGVMKIVRDTLHASGVSYFAWVIPYGVGAMALAALYSRFLWNLPRRTAGLIVVAGVLTVSGGFGFEMLTSYLVDGGSGGEGLVALLAIPEEGLEMAGVVLFLYALMDYAATHLAGVRVSIQSRVSQNALTARRVTEAFANTPVRSREG